MNDFCNSTASFTKVLDILYQAGKTLKPHYGSARAINYKTKFETDVVTKLDQEIEKFLEKELKKIDPSIGFKGEEFGKKDRKERFWLVDPIDGTGLFMRGLWGCSVMLALIENEQIKFSAVYDFISDKMYHAEKGKGSYCNKDRIHVSNRSLKNAFLYVEMNLENKENLESYLPLYSSCTILGPYPSGIHFCLTAEGKVEGRICQDPFGYDYDFAPGQLLVKEAGGVVANIGTNSFNYRNLDFLAVNKDVYKELTTGKNPIFPIK